jgi:hypothetical protein
MLRDKRGDAKYDIILSIIVGLLVVGIVFFWIFQEFFTEDDIDWEVCRESLIVRNSLPEGQVIAKYESSKHLLPLKCNARVINIDYEDRDRAEKEIGQAASECWYMVGRGDYEVFPGSSVHYGGIDTPCMVCARISFDSDVKEYYTGENKVSIRSALNTQLEGYDVTVWDYLNPEKGAQAVPYFGGWNSSGGFYVKFSRASTYFLGSSDFDPKDSELFFFPTYMNPDDGDLFIIYSEPTKELVNTGGERIPPYMIFLQYADFDKLSWYWSFYSTTLATFTDLSNFAPITGNVDEDNIRVCSSIETAPA